METSIFYLLTFTFRRKLHDDIKRAEQEVADNSEIYKKVKQDYFESKNTHSTKVREWRSAQSKIKRLEDDIVKLRGEIHRLERFDKIL